MLDDAQLNFTLTQNETHYIIHAEYTHSYHTLVAQFFATSDKEPDDGALILYIGAALAAVLAAVVIAVLLIRKRRPA